ncbi:MAG: DUF6250 domain-containing protein [Victivallales bacterium]
MRFRLFMPLIVVLVLVVAGCSRTPGARLEHRFAADDRTLVRIVYKVPADAVARSVLFDRKTLETSALYLRAPPNPAGDCIYISADGTIQRGKQMVGSVKTDGELLFTSDGDITLFADGRRIANGLSGWDVFWVSASADAPATHNRVYPHVVFADGFMRTTLEDGQCRLASGLWHLRQHGGGMATTTDELQNAGFQRAANPFTVVGEQNGQLCFGDETWFDFHGEARFYFGVPVEGNVVDINTVPVNTDMLIVQGMPDAGQVAFGWRGESRCFVLLWREGNGDWRELARQTGPRPAVTSWVKLGLGVAIGQTAHAYMDGIETLSAPLPRKVTGPFGIECGKGVVECDDIRVWSRDSAPEPGSLLFVRSSQFAGKSTNDHDPVQFNQWAQGADTFISWRTNKVMDEDALAVIANRIPLMGDFTYTCDSAGDAEGRIAEGLYEFRFASVPMAPPELKPEAAWKGTPALLVRLKENRWRIESGISGGPVKESAGTELRLRRRETDGGRITVWTGRDWKPVTEAMPGALRLMIGFHGGDNSPSPEMPRPEHHRISCTNLVNDLFEESPSDWSWIEGSFRMACRWACQYQWNFMACGSPDTPFMTSKQTFRGEKQFFEYYMSLRPVYPWDAGDPSFAYDPSADKDWKFFIEHEGWYNRHDLDFSFCCDGRNPLSGYSVVFGGNDNRETRLLRKGQVVARTSAPEFLFPTEIPHLVIHWRWWRFSVWKDGGHIQVDLNGTKMLEYTDPSPIDEGHVAFWTVRNGFALSRATLLAERVGWDPSVLYVPERTESPWQPLPADSAALQPLPDGRTRVSRNVGAGAFALRRRIEPPEDLAATPILELPLALGSNGATLNLHLEISGRSFLVEINAPLTEMKALLTPEFEHGECFRLPVIPETTIRQRYWLGKTEIKGGILRIDLGAALDGKNIDPSQRQLTVLTLGNTSNDNYRLGGGESCNPAGASFEAGTPKLVKRE